MNAPQTFYGTPPYHFDDFLEPSSEFGGVNNEFVGAPWEGHQLPTRVNR